MTKKMKRMDTRNSCYGGKGRGMKRYWTVKCQVCKKTWRVPRDAPLEIKHCGRLVLWIDILGDLFSVPAGEKVHRGAKK